MEEKTILVELIGEKNVSEILDLIYESVDEIEVGTNFEYVKEHPLKEIIIKCK